MEPARRQVTINIDTGGTFTDGVVSDGTETHSLKVLTTPHDLTMCFRSLLGAAATRLQLSTTEMLKRTAAVRYSTTVGTNAIIERKGPRIGLLVSARDLTTARSCEGKGLMGEILSPAATWIRGLEDQGGSLDREAVLRTVEELLGAGAERLVVSLSGKSAREREAEVKRVILGEYPRHILGALPVLFSTELTADQEMERRTATAVLNAYLHPALEQFLYNAEDVLRGDRYAYPLFIFGSDGTTNRVAKVTAIKTYNSGPSGGIEAAMFLARHYEIPRLVSIDIGGTSTDCAFVAAGDHEQATAGRIEDVEISFPLRTIEALGAGGGTIAKVTDGRLQLGPESAGAAPGPACFGFGGEAPTVTDACVVIGYLSPNAVLAGQVTVDGTRARKAIEQSIAGPLSVTVERAGALIRDLLEDKIAEYLASRITRRGWEARATVLAAFGGAGPAHACGVAGRLGIRKVVVPALSSVFSAFGVGTSDVVHEYASQGSAADTEGLHGAAATLRRRAELDMKGEGFAPADIQLAWEVSVLRKGERVRLAQPKDVDEWLRSPGGRRAVSGSAAAVTLTLRATGKLPHVGFGAGVGATHVAPRKHRSVIWADGRAGDTPVYAAEDLSGAGTHVPGPAIVEAVDTTIVVPAHWHLTTDHHRQYILQAEAQS